MSRKTTLRISDRVPTIPQNLEPSLRGYLSDLQFTLTGLIRNFNSYIDADLREQRTVNLTGQNVATGLPTVGAFTQNVKRDASNIERKVDKSKASWAIRFGDASDKYEILYSAAGADPIVWSTFLSMNNSGAPTAATDTVRLVDLTSAEIAAVTGGVDSNALIALRKLKDIEIDLMCSS